MGVVGGWVGGWLNKWIRCCASGWDLDGWLSGREAMCVSGCVDGGVSGGLADRRAESWAIWLANGQAGRWACGG